ncbi:hypothetical protein ABEB36_000820 [Hypothenemus hampei]|uniref:Uncharacterized protein n=1 Tax=Hypothenemus hampei TaxID=57062 RepID=A0ABD1FCL5_HYPHA
MNKPGVDNERNEYPTKISDAIDDSDTPEQKTIYQPPGPESSDSKNYSNYVPPTHILLSPEDPSRTFDFSDKSIRRNFVRKVFAILIAQLAITAGFIALFCFEQNSKKFIRKNSGLIIISAITTFVIIIILACSSNLRRKTPANYIFLIIFTISAGFTVGIISSFYDTDIVLWAVGMTAVVCLSLTIFAFQSKWDFTGCSGTLLVLLVILLLFGIFYSLPFFHRNISDLLYGSLGALVFSFCLVYDIQIMMGGNHKYALSPEEYIFAALNLYLDVINLFLFILRILSKFR